MSATPGGVHGRWTGLAPDDLYQGRDLPVHTDYRSVLHEVVESQLGQAPPPSTFPDFEPDAIGLVNVEAT